MKATCQITLLLLCASLSMAAEAQRTVTFRRATLTLTGVYRGESSDGVVALTLQTDRGDIDARYHPAGANFTGCGVLWVGGAGGGLDGPARGLYPAAAERLQEQGIAGLRLHYRKPNQLVNCTLDTLLGVEFLASEGAKRVALVGHSFGGAVVINAGAVSPHVKAVVPMSSQTYGADLASQVSPRPMLLIHGTDDDVLSARCSEQIYADAREPKELRLFKGAGHGLDEARQQIIDLLVSWIPAKLATPK